MKKKLRSGITAFALLGSIITMPFTVPANALCDSPLYPTPDGVEITGASYNEAAPDWTDYARLIEEIRSETDHDSRTEKMHQAEDILMESAALIPILYSCDAYLQNTDVTGIYANPFGIKYFQYADRTGDALKVNVGGEPQTLDPCIASSANDFSMAANLFSGLYTYSEDGTLVPDLADETNPVDVSEDGTVYTFHLKEGLKWSDGSPLTAADFAWSWKRLADPQTGAPYSYMPDGIFAKLDDGSIDVAAEDDLTLTARLKDTCGYFVGLTAMPIFFPVKQAEVEKADIYGNNPVAWVQEAGFVTNGAYTVTEWHHDDAMILTKNPYWHAADRVQNDTLELMVSSDGVSVFAAYSAGNIVFADNIPSNEISSLKKRDDFHIVDMLGTQFFMFNVNSRLFDGKTAEQAVNMRKAVSLLIDRGFIVEDITQRGQKTATSFIPYGMTDGRGEPFKRNSDRYTYPYADDVGYYPAELSDRSTEEAIHLLESAGYQFEGGKLSSKTPLRISFLTSQTDLNETIAQAIQQDLEEIGIDLDIDTREGGVYLAELQKGHFEMSLVGWNADFDDPVGMLEIWEPDSGNNYCRLGMEY